MSDIDIAVVDSLKALDPKRPIREADIARCSWHVSNVPLNDFGLSQSDPLDCQLLFSLVSSNLDIVPVPRV